jgi:hypothetical protein
METQIKVKICVQCGVDHHKKWYGGPLCGTCFGRNHYFQNKEKYSTKSHNYYLLNKEDIIKKHRSYYETNKDKWTTYAKNLSKEKKDEYQQWRSQYRRDRLKWDHTFKVSCNIRSYLYQAIKGKSKHQKTLDLLGCSTEFFIKYIESRFQPGMTWNNYGRNGWHIDHIKPLKSFDLTNPLQLEAACHYTNLQPLWAFDNLSKGSR